MLQTQICKEAELYINLMKQYILDGLFFVWGILFPLIGWTSFMPFLNVKVNIKYF